MSNHQLKRKTLQRQSRRYIFSLSALVGLVAGVLAVFYQVSVAVLGSWEVHLPRLTAANGGWFPWMLAPLGGLLGWLSVRLTRSFAPDAGGSGIPNVKAVLLGLREFRPVPLVVVKLGAGLLALAAGMSLGREGPTIHIGAACAAWLGVGLGASTRTQKNLIAAGAGAGLAAAFNAPLAGFIFTMEELRREMSRLTYGSALVSSVAAVAVARLCLGQSSAFGLNDGNPVALRCLPVVALVGLLGSLWGIAFNRLLLAMLDKRDGSSVAREWWGFAVGAASTLLLCWWNELTGGGHQLTHQALRGELQVGAWLLLAMLLVKFFFTLFSYVTGVPGGLFGPLLCLGALWGTLCGVLFQGWLPYWSPDSAVLATIGMASVLAGSVRAPLTGVVLIVEMTGQYHLLYALLLAAWAAYSLAEFLEDEPVYEALLRRDLKRPRPGWDEQTRVLEVLVEPASQWEHRSLAHLAEATELVVALVEREGETLLPHGTLTIQAGDTLTLVVGPGLSEEQLVSFLDGAKGP
jgi:CIC family chloride channel protein